MKNKITLKTAQDIYEAIQDFNAYSTGVYKFQGKLEFFMIRNGQAQPEPLCNGRYKYIVTISAEELEKIKKFSTKKDCIKIIQEKFNKKIIELENSKDIVIYDEEKNQDAQDIIDRVNREMAEEIQKSVENYEKNL